MLEDAETQESEQGGQNTANSKQARAIEAMNTAMAQLRVARRKTSKAMALLMDYEKGVSTRLFALLSGGDGGENTSLARLTELLGAANNALNGVHNTGLSRDQALFVQNVRSIIASDIEATSTRLSRILSQQTETSLRAETELALRPAGDALSRPGAHSVDEPATEARDDPETIDTSIAMLSLEERQATVSMSVVNNTLTELAMLYKRAAAIVHSDTELLLRVDQNVGVADDDINKANVYLTRAKGRFKKHQKTIILIVCCMLVVSLLIGLKKRFL